MSMQSFIVKIIVILVVVLLLMFLIGYNFSHSKNNYNFINNSLKNITNQTWPWIIILIPSRKRGDIEISTAIKFIIALVILVAITFLVFYLGVSIKYGNSFLAQNVSKNITNLSKAIP